MQAIIRATLALAAFLVLFVAPLVHLAQVAGL